MYSQNMLLATGLVLLAEFLFVSMGAASKLASATLPNESVVFFRNLLGTLLLLPWLLRYGIGHLATRHFRFHLLRAVAGLSAMYCFFYTLANMPLAEAVLFKLTSPLYIPLIALFWLAEPITGKVRWAVLLGFFGVALVLRPGFEAITPVAFIALIGAFLVAIVKVTLRRLGGTEPYTRTVFYFSVLSTFISAVPVSFNWVTPSGDTWGILLLMAACGTVAQLSISHAYARAPAGSLGPFTYVAVIFATFYGWLLWDELPDLLTYTGAGLIVAAGILASQRQRRDISGESEPATAATTAGSIRDP